MTYFNGLKNFVVVGVVGAYEAIPKVEIQAVIAGCFGVVQVVARGRIDPFEQLVAGETAGRKFMTGVSENVE
jgi:hypothetical protein